MNRLRLLAALTLISLTLSACGGGGGGVNSNRGETKVVPPNTTTDTVISGMASKGPIDGDVNIYTMNADGSKVGLTHAKIAGGRYSANIGKHAGPVLIEVSGSYTDEATGVTYDITADAPLRAALSNASGPINIAAVTPLTELAVQKAGTLTASNIDAGNKLISDIFKIDIINTQPVAPTTAAFSDGSIDQTRKDYTLALAALSQLSHSRNGEPLTATLATVARGITPGGMNSQTVTDFQAAVVNFIKNPNNTTGINSTDLSATNLARINGGITVTYRIEIAPASGTAIAANDITGIQFEIVVPSGLTVRSDASGATLPGVVSLSASVAAAQGYVNATFSTSSGLLFIDLMTSTGVGPGGLATITCDIAPGWTAPAATAFTVRNITATGNDKYNTIPIPVTVTVN